MHNYKFTLFVAFRASHTPRFLSCVRPSVGASHSLHRVSFGLSTFHFLQKKNKKCILTALLSRRWSSWRALLPTLLLHFLPKSVWQEPAEKATLLFQCSSLFSLTVSISPSSCPPFSLCQEAHSCFSVDCEVVLSIDAVCLGLFRSSTLSFLNTDQCRLLCLPHTLHTNLGVNNSTHFLSIRCTW